MNAKQLLNVGYAAARIGIGVVATVDPARIGRTWIGDSADETPTKVILRGLGARDFALGAGTIEATLVGRGVAAWLGFSALADLGDLTATLAGKDGLPSKGVKLTAFLAGSGFVSGLVLLALELNGD